MAPKQSKTTKKKKSRKTSKTSAKAKDFEEEQSAAQVTMYHDEENEIKFEVRSKRDYYKGTFNGIPTKIINVEKKGNLEKYYKIWFDCVKMRAPYLLIPHGVGVCTSLTSSTVAFCYSFDTMLQVQDRTGRSLPIIPQENRRMEDKWRHFIRDMLSTLDIMHQKGKLHGKLGDKTSYVMRRDKAYMIKTEDVEGISKNDDKMAFKSFLQKQLQGKKSEDWDHFLASFDYSTLKQLSKHPLVLHGEDRLNYHRQMADYYTNDLLKEEQYNFNDILREEYPCEGWLMTKNIKKYDVLYAVYLEMKRADTDSSTLFWFVRNVLEHYCERNREVNSKKKASLALVGEQLASVFPKFQVKIHEILIKNFSGSDITSSELP